ncbi:hypothetical protein [Marinobacter sp.]|uniref:hypothetical protein n=1 Tax=Marinobacter sp. TaxID=50741 RepID=UPI00384CAE47
MNVTGKSSDQAGPATTKGEVVVTDPKDQLRRVKTVEKYFNGLGWKEILGIPILLATLLFLPILSFFEPVILFTQSLPNSDGENAATLFGRFGSLTTIGAVIVDLWIIKLVGTYQRGAKAKSAGNYISQKEVRLLERYQMVVLFVLVAGTFIWGFGDLFA